MTELFPYQKIAKKQLYQAIKDGYEIIVVSMPTGAGKTTFGGDVIHQCARSGKETLITMHSKYLVKQFHQRLFQQFNLNTGLIMAGQKEHRALKTQIATVPSLRSRVKPPADIVFIDEGHRSKAATYMEITERYPNAIIVLLTATPFRGDGKNLGSIGRDTGRPMTIIQPVKMLELINVYKRLVGTRVFRPIAEKRVKEEGIGVRATRS